MARRQSWTLTCVLLMIVFASGNTHNALGSEGEPFPSATILETKNIVQEDDPKKWHEFEFHVPQAGPATLKLSIGAKTEVSYLDRIVGVNINICHETCAEIDSDETCEEGKKCKLELTFPLYFFNDLLEIPMDLQAGSNKLKMRMYASPGKWLSLRIDAPTDALQPMSPSATPVMGKTLSVTATNRDRFSFENFRVDQVP